MRCVRLSNNANTRKCQVRAPAIDRAHETAGALRLPYPSARAAGPPESGNCQPMVCCSLALAFGHFASHGQPGSLKPSP